MRRARCLLALVTLGLVACGGDDSPAAPAELVILDLVVGSGATAVVGDDATVHYIGTLEDGTRFDSSYDRGEPFTFRIGAGQVIAGWDQGVPGMRVGGKRRLTIPPALGYGSRAVGPIPPNSTRSNSASQCKSSSIPSGGTNTRLPPTRHSCDMSITPATPSNVPWLATIRSTESVISASQSRNP